MNVKEILLEEYEDAKKELESYDYGSEEYDKIGRRQWAIMDRIIQLEADETKRNIEQMKINAEEYENLKNREHDKEIEQMKRKKSKVEIVIEIGKIAVPAVITIGGYIAYDKFQKRVLKFEETGRIVSTAGRELHLPRFMK